MEDQIEQPAAQAEQQEAPPPPEEKEQFVIKLGDEEIKPDDEESQVADKNWVRELRKTYRETAKQNKELQRRLEELEANKQSTVQSQTLKKPILSEFDYDTEKFEAALVVYHDQKRKEDSKKQEQEQIYKQQNEAWQSRLQNYEDDKKKLGREDYEDAELLLTKVLSPIQQGAIIQHADNPAFLAYAIANNKERVQELAAIKDPGAFIKAIIKLETKMQISSSKKAPPEPEKVVRGSSKVSSVDTTLEKLRAEADRTGDISKVMAYRQKLKQNKK